MKKDITTGNRIEIITNYVKGKRVLDLGCADSKAERSANNNWLHKIIKNEANYVLGIDSASNEVVKLKKLGYNVKCDNVETMNLHEKFDVVVAGELIEHVDNPGLFFDSVRKHIKDDGKFILTTPSPYYIENLMRVLGNNHFFIQSDLHVTYYTPGTMETLLRRHGFSVEKLVWIGRPIKKRFAFVNVLMRLFPFLHISFLMVAVPKRR